MKNLISNLTDLKLAISFLFFSVCLLIFTHQALAIPDCHDCGTISHCENGNPNLQSGWTGCDYSESTGGIVYGHFIDCGTGEILE